MIARLVLPLGLSLLFSWGMALVALAEVAGSLTIVGNGPELRTIESLARAFEKDNPRAYLDVVWDANSKPIELVKSGQAHIAITGTEAPGFSAVPIAWDGIGVLVHLSNFTKEITKQQVADIFSGKITLWSDVGGPETKILVIDRPRNQNIREAFESQLGTGASVLLEHADDHGPDGGGHSRGTPRHGARSAVGHRGSHARHPLLVRRTA